MFPQWSQAIILFHKSNKNIVSFNKRCIATLSNQNQCSLENTSYSLFCMIHKDNMHLNHDGYSLNISSKHIYSTKDFKTGQLIDVNTVLEKSKPAKDLNFQYFNHETFPQFGEFGGLYKYMIQNNIRNYKDNNCKYYVLLDKTKRFRYLCLISTKPISIGDKLIPDISNALNIDESRYIHIKINSITLRSYDEDSFSSDEEFEIKNVPDIISLKSPKSEASSIYTPPWNDETFALPEYLNTNVNQQLWNQYTTRLSEELKEDQIKRNTIEKFEKERLSERQLLQNIYEQHKKQKEEEERKQKEEEEKEKERIKLQFELEREKARQEREKTNIIIQTFDDEEFEREMKRFR